MTQQRFQRPTDAELSILRILWSSGRATVRQVHEALSREQTTGYTTVLKLMQIMSAKGLVDRDESQRAHVYTPRFSEQKTQRQLVADLATRAFSGSASQLVLQALSSKRLSRADFKKIRRMLDELEEEKR